MTWPFQRYIGWLSATVMALYLLVVIFALLACRPMPVAITGTLPVAIVAAPKRTLPSCNLPEIPTAPAEITLDMENPDVIVRTTVNIREYNELRQFSQDLAAWATNVQECIDRITGGGE